MASYLTGPRTATVRRWILAAALLALSARSLPATAAEEPATPPDAATTPATAVPPEAAPPEAATPESAAADSAPQAEGRSEFHGSFELDNQYSAATKPLRATLSLNYSNLFGKLDELAAAYQVSPQDAKQVGIFVASYTAHPL